MALNERQRRFCELYAADPNATAAAMAAGYSEKTARAQGARLLTNVDIQEYIHHIQETRAAARIATVTQAKAFWSDVMTNSAEKTSDRLKASELLARSAGAFLPAIMPEENSGSDVVIYLPKMMTEAECQAVDDDLQMGRSEETTTGP